MTSTWNLENHICVEFPSSPYLDSRKLFSHPRYTGPISRKGEVKYETILQLLGNPYVLSISNEVVTIFACNWSCLRGCRLGYIFQDQTGRLTDQTLMQILPHTKAVV